MIQKFLLSCDPWRWDHCFFLNCGETIIQWCGVIFQKNGYPFIYHIDVGLPVEHNLSQLNPVNKNTSYFLQPL